jgi:MFS family permease
MVAMIPEFAARCMPAAICGYADRLRCFSPNAKLYLLFVFLTTLNIGIYGVIFNLYILSLGFGEDFLGLILSLSSASIGVFAIPAAFVCDRLGRKKTLLLSSLLLSLSLFFLYNTTSRELLMAFSIAYGGASTLSLVTGATFLVENSKSYERMHLFSMYSIIYAISTFSGNMVGGFFPDFFANLPLDHFIRQADISTEYRLTLYISLAAAITSLLPLLYIEEKRTWEKTGISCQIQVYRSVFRSKIVKRMLVFYCIFGLGWGTSLPYFNVFFDVVYRASSDQIGMIFSVSQLLMMAGYFLVPGITERMGKVRMASTVQAASIPFLLMFTLASSISAAAIGYAMRHMLMNMANPVLNSFKLEISGPKERSMINSVMWMACYIFVGMGTYAGGLMMANGEYRTPFLLTGLIYFTSAVLYYMWFNDFERILNAQKKEKIA